MNVSTLPTDNLYKFVALAGLALWIFARYEALTGVRELQARNDQLQLETIELEVRAKRLEENAARLSEKRDPTPEEVRELRESSEESERTTAMLKRKNEVLGRIVKEVKGSLVFSLSYSWIGGLLAALGFSLWYWRLQRWQDREVRTRR